MTYEELLQNKIVKHKKSGFVSKTELNPALFDFQKHIVLKALESGRYAIFADCGLGKTLMQLEWAKQVSEHTGRPVLILAPLAVSGQTIAEGRKFGIQVVRYTGWMEEIQITNYEQLENIDCEMFSGVVLDESSILKNFEGKIRQRVIEGFANTPYKLACTATPAPNDPMELGNHSEFLNIMTRTEMLSMYFVHDSGDTGTWRIKGHAISKFYEWVSTWAVMLKDPSDIGFDGRGFILPKLTIVDRMVSTERKENGRLFNDLSVNATDFNAELRRTIKNRMDVVADIVNNSDDHFIIWIKQNEEADYLKKLIPDAIEVRGNEDHSVKEKKLLDFGLNKYRVLITKTKIAQFGLNYQNIHKQIFASLDFSFESLYQGIRRSWRFGQKEEVTIYIITTDTMQNVNEAISRKNAEFEKMQSEMTIAVNKNVATDMIVSDRSIRPDYVSENAILKHGDSIKRIHEIEDESIGFSIFSPPFADLYVYSDMVEDLGNSKDYDEFILAFDFLVESLYKKMMQGRNVAVHCMDLMTQKGKHGYIGLRDFSGMIKAVFEKHGFIYHSRVTIWKDPVVEMQRTKALGLLHKQLKKDSTMSRVGLPDYLLIFRKDGERENPVNCNIPVELWQKYASPVWMDIDQGDTLNFRIARTDKDERHICPLQLGVIERAITLWSNPGDTVFTPFLGIGSEVFQAIKMQRKGVGIELKAMYYDQAVKNVKIAEQIENQYQLCLA